MQLGDARHGKFADNVLAFGRALRRAGVAVDAARIALAQQAIGHVGVANRMDVLAALETVLISQQQDRAVLHELFEQFFRDPQLAHKLLAQLLPSSGERAQPPKQRARVREALTLPKPAQARQAQETPVELDAAMSASAQQRLRQADFNSLSASEYALVQNLARDIALPLPQFPSRRLGRASQSARMHWRSTLREATRNGGELVQLVGQKHRLQALPLLVLVDISGSMERYARLLLAFLHAATKGLRQREVFAFGTGLSDLKAAFKYADGDAMLAALNQQVTDFAGGTRLATALGALRTQHARKLVGRRTLVLLISDGLDTDEPALLERELLWLKRHSRRLLWLNPLLRFEGYQASARAAVVLQRHADAMVAVHNLEKLEQLAQAIGRTLKA